MAQRLVGIFFQSNDQTIYDKAILEGYTLRALHLLYVNEADHNTKKEVLWGLSNFVADCSKKTKLFIDDTQLCARTLQLTL
jgi:hypothetical protein